MQLTQLPPGVDAELLDQRPTGLLVRLQRLGLPTRPVERKHQETPEPLAQWMLRDEGLELTHELGIPARLELRFKPILDRGTT